MTIDVEERMYAVGKIPGSFFRREGRATERATLSCRLIDRPLRPSFRDGYRNDTHVVAVIMQVDGENPYDVLALNGASAALTLSDLPFEGPIGAVRMGLRNGEWVPFPTFAELEECVVRSGGGRKAERVGCGGHRDGRSRGHRLRHGADRRRTAGPDEESVAAGIEAAKANIGALIDLQLELASEAGREVGEWPTFVEYTDEIYEAVENLVRTECPR